MFKKDNTVKMNGSGEFLKPEHSYLDDKYKPDNPFSWSAIPYVLMGGCVAIDFSFFQSLFCRISYDDPVMIWFEIFGLVFAADIVSVYAGILAKRIKQGLSREYLNLILLLLVPGLALVVNGVLRVATMSLASATGLVDAATIALTIIAIVVPVFTSVGNFSISYLTYDPLAVKMHKEELALEEVKDQIRRIQAMKSDYECDENSEVRLQEMDKKHLMNVKKKYITDALMLGADIEGMLMENQGNPTSTNIILSSDSKAFYEELEKELQLLSKVVDSEYREASLEDTHAERYEKASEHAEYDEETFEVYKPDLTEVA